jgi:meso-butanediol dehydrogenase/(S,S)-butanediol dehydrogenase/diacetyl reductase
VNRLAGKVALITGGGAGIGAATAALFVGEAAAVMLVDADADALAKTARAIGAHVAGTRVATFTADVGDADDATQAVQHTLDAFGQLDVLVNNAAMRNYSAIADAEPAEWRAVIGVNLIGTANYCKAAIPALRRSGRASIVNVCHATPSPDVREWVFTIPPKPACWR